jgi:hypothetical protein
MARARSWRSSRGPPATPDQSCVANPLARVTTLDGQKQSCGIAASVLLNDAFSGNLGSLAP